jgi:alkylation response protein AidB-like acyl-CoA dehydrogenase
MLIQMRAQTEAGRAMSFYAIAAEDRSFHHPDQQVRDESARLVEILTPLVKGWCTEVAMETTSLGVQVHGGMGFIEETGAAQHMRDARILPIYEGTNGIQALDFIGRKCLRDGGEGLSVLIAEMAETALASGSVTASSAAMRGLVDSLQVAIKQCQQALDYVLANPQQSASLAYGYMMLFGNSVAYWLMVKLALAAQKAIDQGSNDRFYAQKVATTEFFANQLLTRNYSYLSSVTGGSSYLDSLDDKDFTTIQ